MKKITLSLLLIFTASMLPAFSATPIKPGTTCSNLGATKTLQGLKYQCIKSGKKLVWSKGVPTKSPLPLPSQSTSPTPSTSPSPTPTKSTVADSIGNLRDDSRITSSSALSSLEICRTTDQTPEFMADAQMLMRNGFPRPSGASYKAKSAKVLVIPLIFKNRTFSKTADIYLGSSSDLDLTKNSMRLVELGFKELSAGRFEVKTELLPESQWWNLNIADPIQGIWGSNNMDEIVRIIEKEKPQFELSGYDAYLFVASNTGSNSAQAYFAAKVTNSKSGSANLALMAGSLNRSNTFIHELGHALFAFEDLYLFNASASSPKDETTTPDLWDIMAGDRLSLLNWNRLLMGWLNDSEVRCVTNQVKSTHYLSSFANNSEPKLVLINLTDGVTIAAEVRDKGNQKGLLIYTINTYVSHGEGPIQTYNSVLTSGMKKSLYGWDISILDNDADGVLFELTKTDVEKFVPPIKKVDNTGSKPTTTTIPLSGGDITRKSSTRADIRWNPSNYESYRIYVTATDNYQKVYFESGFVDSIANPLVVEISGLTCEVDLRVMSQFFTKKGGQGETRVEERTLKRSGC